MSAQGFALASGHVGASVQSRREKEARAMSTYIALANWTPEGIRAVGNAADRLDAIKKLMADMDCHYHSIHMTMGEYDFVLIYDAPDDAVAARLTLQIAKKGFL